MKKETFIRLLIPIGLLITVIPRLINRAVTPVPEGVIDFMIGFGITIMIGSLILQRKYGMFRNRCGRDNI